MIRPLHRNECADFRNDYFSFIARFISNAELILKIKAEIGEWGGKGVGGEKECGSRWRRMREGG